MLKFSRPSELACRKKISYTGYQISKFNKGTFSRSVRAGQKNIIKCKTLIDRLISITYRFKSVIDFIDYDRLVFKKQVLKFIHFLFLFSKSLARCFMYNLSSFRLQFFFLRTTRSGQFHQQAERCLHEICWRRKENQGLYSGVLLKFALFTLHFWRNFCRKIDCANIEVG